MKILYALNSGKPGGMEQHVLDLVEGMKVLGHEVFVWCPEGDFANLYKKAGASVTFKSISFDICPRYIASLAKFLNQNSIDVVHAHELKACTNALLAGALAGTQVRITHIHTPMSQWQISPVKRAFNGIKLLGYSVLVKLFATKEIALTESIKKVKLSEGIPESKLAVIPNGINTFTYALNDEVALSYKKEMRNKYAIPEDAFVFGNVGRFTPEKGHALLVNAFAELIKRPAVPANVYLFLAGGGLLEESIKKLIADLNIQDRVRITGIFDAADKVKLFCAFDVFVFPSLAEGFGFVLAEAMALGLPSISSDLEVLQELGGSTCFYFETANSQSLTDTMFDMFSKRTNLYNIKLAAENRIRELFSMERFVNAYANLYLDLLENNA